MKNNCKASEVINECEKHGFIKIQKPEFFEIDFQENCVKYNDSDPKDSNQRNIIMITDPKLVVMILMGETTTIPDLDELEESTENENLNPFERLKRTNSNKNEIMQNEEKKAMEKYEEEKKRRKEDKQRRKDEGESTSSDDDSDNGTGDSESDTDEENPNEPKTTLFTAWKSSPSLKIDKTVKKYWMVYVETSDDCYMFHIQKTLDEIVINYNNATEKFYFCVQHDSNTFDVVINDYQERVLFTNIGFFLCSTLQFIYFTSLVNVLVGLQLDPKKQVDASEVETRPKLVSALQNYHHVSLFIQNDNDTDTGRVMVWQNVLKKNVGLIINLCEIIHPKQSANKICHIYISTCPTEFNNVIPTLLKNFQFENILYEYLLGGLNDENLQNYHYDQFFKKLFPTICSQSSILYEVTEDVHVNVKNFIKKIFDDDDCEWDRLDEKKDENNGGAKKKEDDDDDYDPGEESNGENNDEEDSNVEGNDESDKKNDMGDDGMDVEEKENNEEGSSDDQDGSGEDDDESSSATEDESDDDDSDEEQSAVQSGRS